MQGACKGEFRVRSSSPYITRHENRFFYLLSTSCGSSENKLRRIFETESSGKAKMEKGRGKVCI